MKYIYTLIGLMLLSQIGIAQNKLYSVLILNEGRYDYVNQTQTIPVSLGKYDPSSKTYEKIRNIDGVRFASDLLIHENFILIAADEDLIKLDRYNYQELDRVEVKGVRKLAVVDDQIFVTRGEYLLSFDSYLHIYDINDLSLIAAIDTVNGPKYATEGMAVLNDKVYVAVNNAFDFGNELGFIGIYDVTNSSYGNEIQLPNSATNPDNIMVDGNMVYTLNNHSFDQSSISIIDGNSSTVSTSYLANVSAGCGTSALYDGDVLYQEMMEQTLYGFDTDQKLVNDSFKLDLNFYGLAVDPVDAKVYATTTDFVSNGALLVYDNWNQVDSISIGVSAGNIAFDVRNTSAVEDNLLESIKLYPNPAQDKLNIAGLEGEKFQVKLKNMNGQIISVHQSAELDLSGLSAGVYLVEITTAGQRINQKLIVE